MRPCSETPSLLPDFVCQLSDVMARLGAWSFKSKNTEELDLEEDFCFDYGAEEIADYRDPGELLAALKQKEEEVILAAQLGNALLHENRQLKDQSDKLHEQYADKLEVRGFYYSGTYTRNVSFTKRSEDVFSVNV